MSEVPIWAYLFGTISTILFMCASLPDTFAAIRATKLVGATWKSPALTAIALSFATLTNIGFQNWPFVFSDGTGVILLSVLAYKRYKLSQDEK